MRVFIIVLSTLLGLALGADFVDYTTDKFQKQCVLAHNVYRVQHGVNILKVDDELVAFAKTRAATLARTEIFKHDAQGHGENLAWRNSSRGISPIDCGVAVKAWYDENTYYNYVKPENVSFHKVGHFTQVVWKNTQRIGCAQAGSKGRRGGVYTVCNYEQPGNYIGRFVENVLAKLS